MLILRNALRGENLCRHLAQAIMLVLALIVILTFRHYGITWDEELQSQYGQAVVDYYVSLFKDDRFREIFNLYLYGGMFDGVASAIDHFTPFSVYETRHLVNAITGLIGIWGVWRLGRMLGGGGAGLVSMILLTLTPMYYGHMFNNPKDIPFAAGIIWSLYYMARIYARLPQPPKSLLIKLGIVYGLTLGVRIGGVMLGLFWCVPLLMDVLRIKLVKKDINGGIKLSWQYLTRFMLPVGLITYAVMLLCWPWAQVSPIMNPIRALGEFSNFPQDVEVLLDGSIYRSTQLPWNYVPLYLGVQLPEFLLLLLPASCIFILINWRHMPWPRRQFLILMALMASFPICYAMIRRPALYDAVRHFLFAVPLACVISGYGSMLIYRWALKQFKQSWSKRLITISSIVVMLAFAGIQIALMVELHPYEYIYVNRFAGGVPGAYGRYELDYWGSSFKEATKRLQETVAAEGGIPDGKIYRIAICGPWDAAMIYLPPDYEPVEADKPAEFFLSTTRWICQDMRPGKQIISIERMGVPLSIVKDLRGGNEYYDGNKEDWPADRK